ncbi:MAG TPA: hypothetical protein VEI05_00555 [Burkholderiaceae bacterium]|nr:hypothetical protein [Burkholderiaceae bacterium]
MFSYPLPAIITLRNVVLPLSLGTLVGRARSKYRIVALTTSGEPMFERTFRV